MTSGLAKRAGIALAAALIAAPAFAQSVPTGYQEYFVVGREQHVWDMMEKVRVGQGGAFSATTMDSVVTATATADGQVIYLDHWEDGLDSGLDTLDTAPFGAAQSSTVVLGDDDVSNGNACDFNAGAGAACGTANPDRLFREDFVNLISDTVNGANCTVPSVQPLVYTAICSAVPVNPRCATLGACTNAEFRFDGGDRVVTSGGPVSVVHDQDPDSQYIGGATEMLSRQAVEAATLLLGAGGRGPLPVFGGDNGLREPFHYVDLNLVAFEDNTMVFVNSPGAGSVSFTLNQGEHWSSLGRIDDAPHRPGVALTINAGTKVSTSGRSPGCCSPAATGPGRRGTTRCCPTSSTPPTT